MDNKIMRRIAIGLLAAASLVAVGSIAYRAGERDDDIARELVVDEGTRTVIVSDDGWRDGWGGPGFGVFFVPLLVVGLILFFGSRRRRWGGGPWRRGEEELREWHRRAHAEDASTSASGPLAPPTRDAEPPTG